MSRNPGITNRLQANMPSIVNVWKKHTPLKVLADRFGCSYQTMRRAVMSHLGKKRYKKIVRANHLVSHQGNKAKLYADLDQIEQRFRSNEGLASIISDYHVNPTALTTALLTRMTREEYRNINRKTLARCGENSRFEKGMKPWNKNVKGLRMSPATEFKKGHLPANHKPVGTIEIRGHKKRGYQSRWIKVSGLRQGSHRWIEYSKYIWMQNNGPIPEGMIIAHADGDTLNDSPDNLILITRAEHLRRIKDRGGSDLQKKKSKSMKAAWARRRAKHHCIDVVIADFAAGKTLRELSRIYIVSYPALRREIVRRVGEKRYRRLVQQSRTQRVRRRIKAAEQAAAQAERERIAAERQQKAAARRDAISAERKQEIQNRIAAARRPDRVIWMCSSCGETYDGDNPPIQCTKCNRGGFEKNTIPQRLAI